MSKEEKTITVPRKYVFLWVIALIVAICCFISGWMLANSANSNVNNKNNVVKTEKVDERPDYMVIGGMSYEKDRKYYEKKPRILEKYWK